MFLNIIDLYKSKNIKIFPYLIIYFLPLSLLFGSAVTNLFVLSLGFFFIVEIIKLKNFEIFNNIFFLLMLVFSASLIINIFFNTGDQISFERQVGFLRFFIFVFALKYYFKFDNFKFFNETLKVWSILFVIITIDIYFEFIFGYNLIGNSSVFPGRIASFLGEELKIGNFYNGFIFVVLSYLISENKISFNSILLILIFLIASFIIGERSNFIKIFLGFFIFMFFFKKIKNKFIIITLLILIPSLIGILHQGINDRIKQIVIPVYKLGIYKYIVSSHYGAHYDTALKIFKENKSFGIGLKQFRYESAKEKYDKNINNIYKRDNWATHPHQLHFEFLSETGLFGYINFILFFIMAISISIKNYIKSKNIYLLCGIIFVTTSILPIIPSGSFFTTYTATIFWLNFSLMITFSEKKN